MKALKKGHRKGSYNPIAPASSARPGFRSAPREPRPLEMHQATCISCKKFCEVPFKPNGKKPVFCRDCFGRQDSEPARAHARPASERGIARASIVPRTPDLAREIGELSAKIDTLTRMVEALGASARKEAK